MGKTLLPENFAISESVRQWARVKVPQVNLEEQFEMFCDYWRAHGKKMLDWDATLRNWLRRAPEFARPPVNHASQVERRPTKRPECQHGIDPSMCVYCRRVAGLRQ